MTGRAVGRAGGLDVPILKTEAKDLILAIQEDEHLRTQAAVTGYRVIRLLDSGLATATKDRAIEKG